MTPTIPFISPKTGKSLERSQDRLIESESGNEVAQIINDIPRFVSPEDNYAESFGWQWNKWHSIRSSNRSNFDLKSIIKDRTHFDEYETEGKCLLECGMGGGDDTEVLLSWPFAEVHSFDLSTSVERAGKFINDRRLTIAQASIFEIPYADQSFDFVFCHRVLQHTPDPVVALRCICRKVKLGGILFAHSYHCYPGYMMEWRYKYRWLTKRMPHKWILNFIEQYGETLHRVNAKLYNYRKWSRFLAYNFIPFYYKEGFDVRNMSREDLIVLEKLITFDALTPLHDNPMTSKRFRQTIESEGFLIEHIRGAPLIATARRVK
jgi:ubiquinone/menaquinone biosynthesis C-methylase UbiE